MNDMFVKVVSTVKLYIFKLSFISRFFSLHWVHQTLFSCPWFCWTQHQRTLLWQPLLWWTPHSLPQHDQTAWIHQLYPALCEDDQLTLTVFQPENKSQNVHWKSEPCYYHLQECDWQILTKKESLLFFWINPNQPDGSFGQGSTTCHDEWSSEIIVLHISEQQIVQLFDNLEFSYFIRDDLSSAPGSSLRGWTVRLLLQFGIYKENTRSEIKKCP